MRLTLLLALLPSLALAQSPTPRPEDLGTVTGHITCADTQCPARNATISIVPVKPDKSSGPDAEFANWGKYGPVHTDLTGAYVLANVPPGQYYLRVDLEGYATPLSQFTYEELNAPTPEIQQQLQRELQPITISANSTTRADTTIRRGGSIAGTVIYDDGSPAINLNVQVYRRDSNGKLRIIPNFRASTDSHGQFKVDSLVPGDYVVKVMLALPERRLGTIGFSDGRSREAYIEAGGYFLPIYSGNVFREDKAAILKVDAGQDTDGAEITIPLDALHEISGTILGKDGRPIGSANIRLLFADTHDVLTQYFVSENGTFRLAYVPDGSYILKVTNAFDFEMVEVHDSNNPTAPTHREQHATHSYADLSQTLTVQTSDQSLNLILPDKPPSTTPTE